MHNNNPWWNQNPWEQYQNQEESREKLTKQIPLESLARQNNLHIVIQNTHAGWVIRWGEPEQLMSITNRAALHDAVDVFAGTPDENRQKNMPSTMPEPLESYQRQEDDWEEFAGELAAGLQACLHGMSAGHPALPIVNALLAKAKRKGLL